MGKFQFGLLYKHEKLVYGLLLFERGQFHGKLHINLLPSGKSVHTILIPVSEPITLFKSIYVDNFKVIAPIHGEKVNIWDVNTGGNVKKVSRVNKKRRVDVCFEFWD